MEITYFVYLLTFANGKVYVGMSRTDARGGSTTRYRDHSRTAKSGQQLPIYHAWRKHGAPVQTILSTHSARSECALAEINAIEALDSTNPERGYNLAPGGEGIHVPPGSPLYELMRARVWDNPDRRRKSSEALKGKPLPPETRAGHAAHFATEAGKAQVREMAQRPDVRAKKSEAMHRRYANGYAEHISATTKGKPKRMSAEGRERQRAASSEWLKSEAGRTAQRAGVEAMLASPLMHERRAAHANSDANKAHCAQMSAAARKPIKDLTTGQHYESLNAAARALGVSGPTIGYRLKRGKFAYL